MWMLIALLAAPPQPSALDVTDRMALPPGKVSLDLSENLILGDPQDAVPATLRAHLPTLEACMQRVGLRMIEGYGVSSMDLRIRADGSVDTVRISGASAQTNGCLFSVLQPVRFLPGRTRSGLVKLTIPKPKLTPISARVGALEWTAKGDHLRFALKATRTRRQNRSWALRLKLTMTADGADRCHGASPLRYNRSHLSKSGRSKNAFSLQTSSGTSLRLAAGKRATFETTIDAEIRPGELYSAQIFVLAGDCKTGTGRYEVGTVQLDARAGAIPALRALPTWSYRVHERHK